MTRMFLVFSHKLTLRQKEDAKKSLQVDSFIYLPDRYQHLWSDIDPNTSDLENLLAPLLTYLMEEAIASRDYILIQGDFGACYYLVSRLTNKGYRCIYSTSQRRSEEFLEDGEVIKKSIFEHVKFRRYK